MNIKQLKQYLKESCVKGYSRMKKNDLEKLVSVIKIQRMWRRIKCDKECLITLEPVKYPYWYFKHENFRHYYNLEPLIEYIVKVGQERAIDPATGIKYTLKDFNSINNMLQQFPKIKTKFKIGSIQEVLDNTKKYKAKYEKEDRINLIIDYILEDIYEIQRMCLFCNTLKVDHEIVNYNMENIRTLLKRLSRLDPFWCDSTFKMIVNIVDKFSEEETRNDVINHLFETHMLVH